MAKKYIDAEKLIANLERQNVDKKVIEPLIRIIDSLQQEQQPAEGLEEVAENYRRESCNTALKPHIDGPMPEYGGSIKDAFIAGAEWQKTKMMKDAVEGVAHPDDCEIWVNLVGYGYDIKEGDKVRIIIVKDDWMKDDYYGG